MSEPTPCPRCLGEKGFVWPPISNYPTASDGSITSVCHGCHGAGTVEPWEPQPLEKYEGVLFVEGEPKE